MNFQDIIELAKNASTTEKMKLVEVLFPEVSDPSDDDPPGMSFESRTNRNINIVSRLLLMQARNIDALAVAIKAQGDQISGEIRAEGNRVSEEIGKMDATISEQQRVQSSFRGVYAEAETDKADLAIAGLFAPQHGISPNDLETWPLCRRALRRLYNENRDAIEGLDLLGDNPTESFRRPDIIAAVTLAWEEQDDPPTFYITVEA